MCVRCGVGCVRAQRGVRCVCGLISGVGFVQARGVGFMRACVHVCVWRVAWGLPASARGVASALRACVRGVRCQLRACDMRRPLRAHRVARINFPTYFSIFAASL